MGLSSYLMINFIIKLLKFAAEHRHFDNVLTQFIFNKRIDAGKADVNLLTQIARIEIGSCYATFVVCA